MTHILYAHVAPPGAPALHDPAESFRAAILAALGHAPGRHRAGALYRFFQHQRQAC